ncbi:MAG TPA: serine/threonine-protein kinase [Candidatus Acidoferrales bacterium]|nr:serine/threonine-protein kinase [Candidatus Acidoferrales bacterium]
MGEDVRALFHEFAGLNTTRREDSYARRGVSASVRAELESLLAFDVSTDPITAVVQGAAEQFLLDDAPVSGERRCGPYRLLRLLGNGGMGAVFLAERADGEVEQKLAIKFVRADQDLPSFHHRFLRERQILASLNHPGIARLLDAGHSAGQPYLAMEYVEGTRIDRYCDGLDARQVVELFIQVCEAVSYAHRNLIVHRDLKPSNILVDAAGRPKLLDFGIARLLDVTEETHTWDRAATPEYASPEQLRGDPQATTTDIYSLGAVLYRLLTGLSPREFTTATREIPKDLAAIVGKAMREEPGERYGSVDLLIADLRAYLECRPVQARRGSTWYRARKFARRHGIPLVAAALAAAGIVGGLLVANRSRAVAERRFQEVRRLSRQFLDLDADIRVLPGSTKARKRIVSASLDYLQRLAAGAGRQDLDLKLEIAEAYLKVARVQGVPINANLGQFVEAGQSLAKADVLVESVLAAPRFSARRRALLVSAEIARDSMILAQAANRRSQALALSDKSAGRLEALLAMPGYSADEATAAAAVYVNLAQGNSNLHRVEQGALYARRAVEICRANERERLQLGKALGMLANTARFSGDLDGSLAAIRESRTLAENLAHPDDTESMLHLSAALWREGLILGELNSISLRRPGDAEPLLQRALDIDEALARKDPDDYTSRSYVSMAGRELGDILREKDPARALAVYDLSRQRLAEIKENAHARRDEVWLLAGSSYALRKLGRTVEAQQRIDAALENLRGLKEYPAAKVEPGGESDAAVRALADHYAATGRLDAAIRTYEELLEEVMASNPQPLDDLRHANALARLYGDLAKLQLRSGRAPEANALGERRLELWRHWNRKLPGNAFVMRELNSL